MKRQNSFGESRTRHRFQVRAGTLPRSVLLVRLAGSLAALTALLAIAPKTCAQANKPSDVKKASVEPSAGPNTAGTALSHDLSGVWMQYPEGNVPGLPGMNAVDVKHRPPLTPWGQARFDAASPNVGPRVVPGKEGSPHLKCDPEGPPMLLILPNPFEIVQVPGRVFMFFEEQHIWRTIWADGRPLPKDPEPSWLGYSVGKWEGDTFVVDTVGFNDKLWADPYGDPRSEQMHLTERYRRLNHDTLEMQIIIDDPKSYKGIWVSPPKLHKLEPDWQIAEWFCVNDEDEAYDQTVRKPAGVAQPK